MEDRRSSFVAAAVGGLAIGGFWMARPDVAHSGLRILKQQNLPLTGLGLDWDAATLFQLKPPLEAIETQDDRFTTEYRIVDAKGHIYPLAPMSDPAFVGSLKLQRGYSDVLVDPHLEVVVQGRVVAKTPVAELPKPIKTELVAKPNPFIALVYHDNWLEATPRGRIPSDERWRIVVRRTRYLPSAAATAMLPNRGLHWPTSMLRIPFPDEAAVAEIELSRYRLRKTVDTIRVPGLRLETRYGGTAIVVDDSVTIPNHLGLKVRLPKQYSGPYRQVHGPNTRLGRATMSIGTGITPNFFEGQLNDPMAEIVAFGTILSPAPESLGLMELRIGPAFRRAVTKPTGPLKKGPFSAVARITLSKPYLVDRVTTTVPIEFGPQSSGRILMPGYDGRSSRNSPLFVN